MQNTPQAPRDKGAVFEPHAESEIPNLTDVDVARLTGIALPTLRKWRVIGRGPRCFKIGACVRYRRADVLSWATQQMVVDGCKPVGPRAA
jgi:predicted DNA-binding transcriptional regulator AlpA